MLAFISINSSPQAKTVSMRGIREAKSRVQRTNHLANSHVPLIAAGNVSLNTNSYGSLTNEKVLS